MRACLTHQRFHGQIVQDVARVIYQSILSVRCIGVEGDVGDDAKARKLLFDRPNRGLSDAVRVPGLARIGRLFFLGGDRKQAIAGILSRTSASHSRINWSMDNRSMPGIDATGWRAPRPSVTKTG